MICHVTSDTTKKVQATTNIETRAVLHVQPCDVIRYYRDHVTSCESHVTHLLSLERRDAVSETVEGVLYVVSSPPLKKIVMGSLVSVELYTLEKERQTVYTEVSTYLKRGILSFLVLHNVHLN